MFHNSIKKVFIDEIPIFKTSAPFDTCKHAILNLKQFCYTIVRKTPEPQNINIIDRATLEAYDNIDLSNGGTEENQVNSRNARKYYDGSVLTSLLVKRLFEDYDSDFAFAPCFGKIELDMVRE